MTLIFIGHNFKYEIEAVCKLFFPVQGFEFLCPDGGDIPDVPGDSVILSRKVFSGQAELSCETHIGGRALSDMQREPLGEDFEHRCELTLCKLMFRQLRELTGIVPKWGILTGVRPVKLISRLLRETDEAGVYDRMGGLYVSREKVRLGLETAKNQALAIADLPKNSVSLYVSIPFCPSRCAYCSFVSQTVGSFYKLMPEYVSRLCDELRFTADTVRKLGLKLDTVYFGGGTPTSLEPAQLDTIMRTISREFDISSLREYTVEAGRPDTVTIERLKVIKDNGGDRVSVNPQTMQPEVLKAIGRKHTVGEFLEAYELAKQTGFKAVNVDLIAGLPSDSYDGFCDTLRKIIALEPENITVHALSIKRAADLMQQREQELSAAATARMIEFSGEALHEAGYSPYYLYRQKNQLGNLENVGWERGGTAGIYNINMMEELQTVLAVGAGASTKIVAGESIKRLYNPKYPLEYIKRFDETVIPRKIEAEKAIAEAMNV